MARLTAPAYKAQLNTMIVSRTLRKHQKASARPTMPAGMKSRMRVFSPSTLMATLSTGGPPILTRSGGNPSSFSHRS